MRNALFLLPACALLLPGQEPPAKDLKLFSPLPAVMESKDNPITPEKVELGKMLYFETRLSKSQKFSCNSCHMLDQFGVDNEPTSDGHKNQRGDRNSPTTFNAAGHFVQFWDGRAPTVEEQAKGPVLNPVEMAMTSEKEVVKVLNSMPEYKAMFAKAFPGEKDPVTFDNYAKAVGAFERRLVTPSRWDEYLKGRKDALTTAEKAGFVKFVQAGCSNCHAGAYLGGAMYQKLGVAKPWPDPSDQGRFKVTKKDDDKMVFKIPTLRNVAKTAPYYHSGKVTTLDEAVSLMSDYQTGKKLTPVDVKSIVTWLNVLTAQPPKELVAPPILPASTRKTPKPAMTD